MIARPFQRAVRSSEPPRYRREPLGSRLDPFREEIHQLLRADPRLPGTRVRELISELGFCGYKILVDNYPREVRPLYLPRRTDQRTTYRRGEIVQSDLFEPRAPVPVGYGQSRRAWVLVTAMCFSRSMVGALMFSKEGHDVLWGLGRCLWRLSGAARALVTDREGCLHAGSGRPTDELAGFCGRLPGTRARAQQTTPSPLRSSGVPAGGTLVTVLNFDGPQPGNFVPAQIRASEAARATLGLDSHVVAPEQARGTPWVADVEAAGFGVSFVDRETPFPRLAGQLASTLRERSARLVHSHFTRFDLHCALAGPSAGTKVLWHVHSGLRGYPRAQRVKDLVKVRLLGRLCDSVVANSEQTYRDCLMRGFPPRKIDLVLNGLVLERLAPARERRVAARAELGVPDDAFVFLAFGWDPERKGVDLILRATEALAARAIVPGVLVTLTGREPLDAAWTASSPASARLIALMRASSPSVRSAVAVTP